MTQRTFSRRALIVSGLAATVGCAVGSALTGAVRADEAPACVDPDRLSGADASLRSAMEYVRQSPDPATRCSACAFFTADGEDGRCGECAILSGPVDDGGHCMSWSPRE